MSDEEKNKKEQFRNRVREILSKMTLDELSYTLGRYCGPSNHILSEKKYGFIMPKDLVEKEFQDRAIESILLTPTDE